MGWQVHKLGDLCTIEKGNTGITKAIAGEYPLVVLGEERKTHNEYQFEGDAVIIPLVSSTGHGHKSMKRIHFQSGKFALGSILCAVIPKDISMVSAQYLFRYLDLNKENELVARMHGMANVSLPMSAIADIDIPLPPLKEQIEIVERLGGLEKSNRKILDELSNQITFLKNLRQQILQDAIQGKLVPHNPDDEPAGKLLEHIKAEKELLVKQKKIRKEKPLPPIKPEEIPFEIPEGWIWCRLGTVIESASGGTPERNNLAYYNGRVSWLKSGELNDGLIINPSEEKITEAGLHNSSAKVFHTGTLLIALYGATAGKLGILQFPSSTNQAICGLFQNSFILTKYLFYYLIKWREKMIQDSWGQAQPNISQKYLRHFLLALPPLSEQYRIVQKIDQLMQTCDELEQTVRQNQNYTQELLQVALKEALNP